MKSIEQKAAVVRLASEDADRSLESLYRRYGAWLGGALRRQFGAAIGPFAEDLVQETYVRLAPYQAAGAIRHPQAFLLRVASNIARDQLRREKRERQAAEPAPSPSDRRQDADQMAVLQLRDVILSLPAPYRDVFVLSRFGGLTYEEIAHHCGLSIKTVEWRMTKALAHCARRLQD